MNPHMIFVRTVRRMVIDGKVIDDATFKIDQVIIKSDQVSNKSDPTSDKS